MQQNISTMTQKINQEHMANIRRSLADAGIYFDKLYINQVWTSERKVRRTPDLFLGVLQQSNHGASHSEEIAQDSGQSVAEALLRFGCETNVDGKSDW